MFQLKSVEKGGQGIIIAENTCIVIGRKDCDFVSILKLTKVSGDPSISRKHATITNKLQKCTLIDQQSKYNTYLNDNLIPPNEPVDLNNGDVIKFGQYSSIYKFTLETYVLAFSQMDKKLKHQLALLATDLNFIVHDKISSECTHLVMERIYITSKVIVALGYGIPIVNVNWLKLLFNSKYIDDEECLPIIAKDDLNCETLYTKGMEIALIANREAILSVNREAILPQVSFFILFH
jgi:pSer/pThr/pTyr-binding forkhead associated (FHA) protein